MILSLVEVHQDERMQYDDVITGKGKGVIFLLHGEPGTGKTLTAGRHLVPPLLYLFLTPPPKALLANYAANLVVSESIADHCRKPVLRIDASILGTTAFTVEQGLASAFQLAETWKVVALLDEADVFLEHRTALDLERNSLVAVFLRMMEYYEGILFLTTNRVDSFDRAFKSRVHLAIHFPKLDWSSRRQLWTMFLTRAAGFDAWQVPSDSSIDEFAEEDLNGRQIKNIVKVAKSLAIKTPERSMEDNVRSAVRAMRSFDQDFSKAADPEGASQGSMDDSGGARRGAKRRRIGE